MKQCLVLSKENIELAKAEALALAKTKQYKLMDNLLILNTSENLSRLAMTKSIYKLLFITTSKELNKKMISFNWQKEYEQNFCVRLHDSELKEKDFADVIWYKLKSPKVNLTNPKTSFELFFIKNKVLVGKKLQELQQDFDKRQPKTWPAHHPTCMKPKLARTIINLTGIQKGTFYDPMCGAGGFLIEAGIMGFSVIGYDIDKTILNKAKINLAYYKIKHELKIQDATKIKHEIKYLATDLPYGRATGKINRPELYLAFLKNLKKILTGTAVIIFPHYCDYKGLIKQAKLKINQEFSVYTHHTLTRKIVVIKI